jgi:tetratricopeptide (TPR) repeat protein
MILTWINTMEHSTDTSTLPDFNKLWNFSDPAGTELRFRELLPAARQSGDQSYLAQLLTQIARTEGLQRRFDDAHRTLDEVEPMPGDELVRVRYLLERGRTFNSSGDRESAKPLFIEAWERARDAGIDYYAVDALHMIAIAAPDESLEWNERAVALVESTSDQRAKLWLGSLYNNIGWTWHERGEYEKALENFEKCLQWHHERNTGEGEFIARWSVARVLRSLKRTDEAFTLQQQLLEDRATANAPSDGYVQEELGECLLALGRAGEAAPYFAAAYELLSQDEWLCSREPERIERLKRMGEGGSGSR